MFSSFTSLSVPKFGFGRTAAAGTAIDIPKVEIHDVETSVDKRGRRLKHLLKLNHATFSILYNHLRFHNHTPHHLGSVYILGGTADQLNDVYEDTATNEGHDHWKDSPGEIALHDYREFLGKKEYQRAFVDFFEDQVVLQGYDWHAVVAKFLFESGSKNSPNPLPMFNSLVAGLGHPLIHLGYAFELNSREVAMEALGLAATCYEPKLASLLTRLTSTPSPSPSPLSYSTTNLFEIFARIASDTRLNPHFSVPGSTNLTDLLSTPSLVSILLEHVSAWTITAPTTQFQQSQSVAAALLISTSPHTSPPGHGYDFFLVHLLTTSHAVRILIPFFPTKYHIPLVREWALIACAIYIAQLRPTLDPVKHIKNYDTGGRGWDDVEKAALQGKHKFDAHFVKAVRALKEAKKAWGSDDNVGGGGERYWEKAAVRLMVEFKEWGGFGREDEAEMEELKLEVSRSKDGKRD